MSSGRKGAIPSARFLFISVKFTHAFICLKRGWQRLLICTAIKESVFQNIFDRLWNLFRIIYRLCDSIFNTDTAPSDIGNSFFCCYFTAGTSYKRFHKSLKGIHVSFFDSLIHINCDIILKIQWISHSWIILENKDFYFSRVFPFNTPFQIVFKFHKYFITKIPITTSDIGCFCIVFISRLFKIIAISNCVNRTILFRVVMYISKFTNNIECSLIGGANK